VALVEVVEANAADAHRGIRLVGGDPRARHDPVFETLLPEGLEPIAGVLLLPVLPHEHVARGAGATVQHGEHLVGGAARLEELSNERLDDAGRAVEGAGVAPRLQVVPLRDVPHALARGGVHREAQMNRRGDVSQVAGERHVGGGGVGRVAAQDGERVHLAGGHVVGQRAQGRVMVLGSGLHRLDVFDRRAHRAQRFVHPVDQRVHRGRHCGAGGDERGAPVGLQVACERVYPLGAVRREIGRLLPPLQPQPLGNGADDRLDLARASGQAVIRHPARDGGRALGHVEAIHGRFALPHPAPLGKVAGVAHAAGPGQQKVVVDTEDDLGLVEAVDGLSVLPVGSANPFALGVAGGGLVLVPLGVGKGVEQRAELGSQRGGGHSTRQYAQAASPCLLPALPLLLQGLHEGGPCADGSPVQDVLRTVRVVEVEHGALHEGVGPAEAGRMIGVALNLGGPPHVALGDQALRIARQGEGGGKEERLSRDHLFGRIHVRHDRLLRRLPAAREPDARNGQRGPHEAQKPPPARRIVPLRRPFGKLPVQRLFEFVRLRKLLEALPVVAAGAVLQAFA